MNPQKITLKAISYVFVSGLVFFSALALAGFRPNMLAKADSPDTLALATADAEALPPPPVEMTELQSQANRAALSSTLSYYFIPGNTFTPWGNVPYTRQVTGCVNQAPAGTAFSAPVHLPKGSEVVSITLFTFNTESTCAKSRAYFILNDGKGGGGYTVSAESLPNTTGYQQNDSSDNNPATIDPQNYNYLVEWRTDTGNPSPYLSLCGVRVAYYAPSAAAFLPYISNRNMQAIPF